jgi:hypothetical protein
MTDMSNLIPSKRILWAEMVVSIDLPRLQLKIICFRPQWMSIDRGGEGKTTFASGSPKNF